MVDKYETGKLVRAVIEGAGYEVRSYSGRGMYGKRCLGVELGSSSSIGGLMADVVREYGDTVLGISDVDELDEFREVIDGALKSMRWDSMGQGIIVYFEQVDFVGEETES